MLLIIFPVACSEKDTVPKKSNKTVESTDNTSFLFSSNRLVSENQMIFINLIRDNPIDNDYHSALCDETTQSMVKIEVEFAEIWKEELQYSCKKFTALLNEKDKITFNSIQNDWES